MSGNTIRDLNENPQQVRELLEIHLQKPEKVEIFADAFKKTVVNDTPVFAATWSWYAFFGGPFYFFYRKLYAIGAIILLAGLALGFIIPFFNLALSLFSGITAKYFYIKKFIADLNIAGYGSRSPEEVKDKLKILGGYNTWALVLFFVLIGLFTLGGIIAVIGVSALADRYY